MARQSTLNVSLTPPLREFVQAEVSSGRYESASEVVRDGLRALQDREKVMASFWSDARAKLAVARQDVAGGRTVDGPSTMDEILTELGHDQSAPRRRRKSSR